MGKIVGFILFRIMGYSKCASTFRPQYLLFQLHLDEVTFCLELAGRGVLIASWLAAVCRTELSRFREFISWLRFGKVFLSVFEAILDQSLCRSKQCKLSA